MKQNQDAFDIIITDSSDPVGRWRCFCFFIFLSISGLVPFWVLVFLQDLLRVCSRSLTISWWRQHWQLVVFFVPKVSLCFSMCERNVAVKRIPTFLFLLIYRTIFWFNLSLSTTKKWELPPVHFYANIVKHGEHKGVTSPFLFIRLRHFTLELCYKN